MDQQACNQLIQALEITYNPSSRQDLRKQAIDFIENFKQNLKNPLPYAVAFLQKQNPTEIKHFAFNLLEYFFSHQWEQTLLPKSDFKTFLFQFAAQGTHPIDKEIPLIKQKTSALIIELLKREWPRKMRTLLDDVIELSKMGPIQCEIALLSLKTFAEELSNEFASNLASERRRELVVDATANLPKVLETLYQYFEKFYPSYCKSPEFITYRKLIQVLLQTCISLISEWVKMKLFFDHKFVNVWCHLLQENDFKTDACTCLELLAGYQIPTELTPTFISAVGSTAGKIIKLQDKNDLRQNYEFHKAFCNVVATFGLKNLTKLDAEKNASIVKNYCDMLLAFTRHPSLFIVDKLLPVWHKLLSNEKTNSIQFTKLEYFPSYYMPLLEICYNKAMPEVADPDSNNFESNVNIDDNLRMTHYFAKQDLEDHYNYSIFFPQFKCHIHEVITRLIAKKPMQVFEYCAKALSMAYQQLRAGDPRVDKVDGKGFLTAGSLTVCKWDTTVQFFEWVTKATSDMDEMSGKDETNRMFQALLKSCLEFSTQEPTIQYYYSKTFKHFAVFYAVNNSALNAALEKLFTHIQFKTPQEANVAILDLSTPTKNARQEALGSLISLCTRFSKQLHVLLQPLVKTAEQLWKSQSIGSSELTMLYEAFVSLSAELSEQEQANFFSYLLESPKNEWSSQAITQVTADVLLALKSFEILPEPNPATRSQLIEVREKIIGTLHLFYSVAHRIVVKKKKDTKVAKKKQNKRHHNHQQQQQQQQQQEGSATFDNQAVGKYILALLPNVMSLIRTIHSLSSPAVFSRIPPERRIIFSIIDTRPNATVKIPDEIIAVQTKLDTTRVLCYRIFALACIHGGNTFWSNSNLLPMLSNTIFSQLDTLNVPSLRHLLREFLLIFTTTCPDHLFSPVLGNVLPYIYSVLSERLVQSWTQVFEKNKGTVDSVESEEIAEDQVVRLFTRDILDVPLKIFEQMQKTKIISNPKPNTPLAKYCAGHDNLIFTWFVNCNRIISCPDPNSLRKAIRLALRLIVLPCVTQNPTFLNPLADMFHSAIRALMCHKEEEHMMIIELITEIYQKFYSKSQLFKDILMELHYVSEARLENLRKEFTCVVAEKKARALLKKFMSPIAGVNNGTFKKAATILKMPSLAPTIQQGKSLVEETTIADLRNLFS